MTASGGTRPVSEQIAVPGGFATPIGECPGVRPRMVEPLANLGIRTLAEAIFHLPARYEDRRELRPVARIVPGLNTLAGRVANGRVQERRGRAKGYFECLIVDESGACPVRWYNQTYLARQLPDGSEAVVHGRIDWVGGRRPRLMMINPEFEVGATVDSGAHAGRIVPIYPLTRGLAQRTLRQLLFDLAERFAGQAGEHLPAAVRKQHGLPTRAEALHYLHRPPDDADIDALNASRSIAHHRLIFEELYFLQLALLWQRRLRRQGQRRPYRGPARLGERLLAALPFALTAAQERVVAEIDADLASGVPMGRLLQGDVGSGKTIVALLASLRAVEHGEQAAFLAPTELLARQHLESIRRLVEPLGVRVAWLAGGLSVPQRRAVLAEVAAGDAGIVVGTHALFSEDVAFRDLGLAVVDEQHRFGVNQRLRMVEKGAAPHLLAMTATPIPRTLALTLYGDLDLSVLDELPPGRKPVETVVRRESARAKLYGGVRRQIAAGHQVYFVYPTVEQETDESARSATRMAEELEGGPFRGFRVGLVHGRLASEEREKVMAAFAAGETQILVATTVVEVGVDVANATVMIVEHAERFGLAQLHQLRGRVGRGNAPGYCVLMVGEGEAGKEALERLATLEVESDGFKLAEADFAQRGPGEITGTRQWGDMGLRFADPVRDREHFVLARQSAAHRLDAGITGDEIARALRLWGDRLGLVEGG
jgi:ATP-dependent DNA helicase RecG